MIKQNRVCASEYRGDGGAPDVFHGVEARRVTVRAPASIANLGPGFDILAMAIGGLYDTVSVTVRPGPGAIHVTSVGFNVPSGELNVAYAVTREFISKYGIRGVDVYVDVVKGVPPACGLGSSGATAAAVAYALSRVFNLSIREEDLLHLAGIGELHVAGSLHYDNVAASLFGGVVIVDPESREVLKYTPRVQIPVAVVAPLIPGLRCVRKTEYARSLLPEHVELSTHVRQTSALARLIYALLTDNIELLGKSISVDYIAEPHRSKLIPYYCELKELALRNGALGFNISGAGPSVFFMHRNTEEARTTGELLVEFLKSKGVDASLYVSTVSPDGAKPLGESHDKS
ncbi:MAG: homoserine kinase [Desulfurococcaceae archaeon]